MNRAMDCGDNHSPNIAMHRGSSSTFVSRTFPPFVALLFYQSGMTFPAPTVIAAAADAAKDAGLTGDIQTLMRDPDYWMRDVTWHYDKYVAAPCITKRWSLSGKPLKPFQLVRMVKRHYFVARGVTNLAGRWLGH